MNVALTILGLVYPFLFFFGHGIIPAYGFVVFAVILIGLRAQNIFAKGTFLAAEGTSRNTASILLWLGTGGMIVLVLICTIFLSAHIAAKAYPVVLSLGIAFVFGASLFQPQSLVEKLARLREPGLPDEARSYCRKVTMLWAVWLSMNAAIAASLAMWSSDANWVLWTGLISYIVSGVIFAGEFMARRLVRIEKSIS